MKVLRGVTFLELLIVLAILGVVLVLGAANLRPDRFAVNQAARGLAAQVTRARLEAIRQNCPVGVFILTAGAGGYAVRGGVWDEDQDQCVDTVFQTVRFGEGQLASVRLDTAASTLGHFPIFFDPRGVPIGLVNGTVVLTNTGGDYNKRVVISPQGRARIQ
ncbi:GspH/FimT family pseudopilin [Marinithermus hydrothermalis]|uniref:Prepilin-like protein n=1 Tax=Marinithermus hydrothermalis (strain DSM 14884 / JCM 11576 / T1) TaxID=869210 RepID=F2NL48_MARHT|nr:GspH/FimT family pseudopilin [Marinithermus hydrothermalis]AEB11451.1 prepilin-like protein [Marinithermus hydrothermalis DSM 14884]